MTETPKNSPHQVFLVVLGSLIIILGISSLILFFQNRLLRQQISQANAPSPTPFPEASADPTADWNTLSNSNGFTIKYPSNYIIGASAFEPPPPETSTDTIIAPSIEGTTNSIFDKPHIRILALNSQGKTLLQAATENYNANANHPNKPRAITKPESGTFLSKTSIDYQMESTGLVSPADEYLGFDGLYKVRWVEHNNKYFMIYWNEDPTINQILSTFKFTGTEANDTSNWETYVNKQYRFSFKYPEGVILEDKSVEQIGQVVLAAQGFRETNVSARTDNQNNLYLDTASVGEVTVGDTVWKKYILPDGYCDGPTCSSPILAVTTVKNGTKYVFSVFVEKGSTDFTDLETEILSTFIFTN